jgi:hypothetical protein
LASSSRSEGVAIQLRRTDRLRFTRKAASSTAAQLYRDDFSPSKQGFALKRISKPQVS